LAPLEARTTSFKPLRQTVAVRLLKLVPEMLLIALELAAMTATQIAPMTSMAE
jgi:hypothetical protein